MKTSTSIALKLATAASVALAGAALAHPEHGGDGKNEVQQVILLSKADGKGPHEAVRQFRMMRGENGTFTCPNGDETKIDETTGGERTKVLICSDDKLSNADRARKLEETLAKLRSGEHLGAAHKDKVEAALQEAINKLRASN
jgi:hypothetical protein